MRTVVFSPDGKTIASAGTETIQLWDVTTGSLLNKLWDTTGSLIKTLSGHTKTVQSVAFSPDGKTIASGSWDTTIKLWK